MQNSRSTAVMGLALVLMLLLVSFERVEHGGRNASFLPETHEIKVKWLTFEEAYTLHQKEPRKFFIDIYTDWCGWCKRMDATTFSHPVIAEYINEKYYAIKFNAERQDTIYFNGKAYPYVNNGNRGYNQLAFDLADGKMTYPTIVFLNERADRIQAIPGYRDAEELDRILRYFGDNVYRTTDYSTFLSSYKSPIAPSGQ